MGGKTTSEAAMEIVLRAHDNTAYGTNDEYAHMDEAVCTLRAELSRLRAIEAAARRALPLLRLLTVGQIFKGGDDAVVASGLDPWCMNEGRAQASDLYSASWLEEALSARAGEEGAR